MLCALGDATTAVRDESSRTFIRKFSETTPAEIAQDTAVARGRRRRTRLAREKVDRTEMEFGYQVDVRYHGQGLRLTIDVDLKRLEKRGTARDQRSPFDAEHTRLFTFALPLEHEFVTLRAVVQGKGIQIERHEIAPRWRRCRRPRSSGGRSATWKARDLHRQRLRPRAGCKAGNRIAGPAIVMEMDSTTVILPRHHGRVDALRQHPDLSGRASPAEAGVAFEACCAPQGAGASGQESRASRQQALNLSFIVGVQSCPPRSSSATRKPMKKVKVDSVTIDIIESALRNARFEMDTVLFRTAMSPGIREQHDEFPMIANLEGKMVVGQFGSFIHGFLQGYDGTIEDGDIFFTNDPYSVNGAISHAERLADADADLPRRPPASRGRRCSAT